MKKHLVIVWSNGAVSIETEDKVIAPNGLNIDSEVNQQDGKTLWAGKIHSCHGKSFQHLFAITPFGLTL